MELDKQVVIRNTKTSSKDKQYIKDTAGERHVVLHVINKTPMGYTIFLVDPVCLIMLTIH